MVKNNFKNVRELEKFAKKYQGVKNFIDVRTQKGYVVTVGNRAYFQNGQKELEITKMWENVPKRRGDYPY